MRLIRCTNVCFVISAYTSLQVYKHNRVYRDNVDKSIYYRIMCVGYFIPNDPCPPYLRQTVTVIQNPSQIYYNIVYLLAV